MSLSQQILKGSLILLLMRLFLRGSGIISMLVLARLLSTEDFGLVAIVSSAVFLFDILSETGARQYVIQKSVISDDDLNTVWSLSFLLKLAVWLLFVIAIPYISLYFSEPKLSLPLYVISLILPISGLSNPGMVLYQKEFNYIPLFQLSVAVKVVSFVIVMFLAFYLRNYWAMVFGVVISYITKTIGSYYLHSFRPSWSLRKVSEQWNFSKWMLLKGILGYIRAQFDTLMVSKLFGVSALGGYNMMKNLSFIPAQDIVVPATEPLLSSFSKVKGDHYRLTYQIGFSTMIISLLIFPVVAFLAQFYQLVITVLLGQKWMEYSLLLGIMSILILTFSFVAIFQHALTAVGKVKIIFMYDLFSVITVISLLLIIDFSTLIEFTIIRCVLALVLVIVYSFFVFRIFSIKVGYLMKLIFPIIIACLGASYIAYLVDNFVDFNPIAMFVTMPIVFFATYFFIIFLLFNLYNDCEEIIHLKKLLLSGYKMLVKN